jgi:hypothetical protein
MTKDKAKKTSKQDKQVLVIKHDKDKSYQRQVTEEQLSPTLLNTVTVQSFVKSIGGGVDLTEAMLVMNEKSDKIIAGDLSELESTLNAQAISLNAIFNTLAERSGANMGNNNLKTVEIYMRLALKAQAQCARTIEVLAAMKNPPIVFAKQANIAHGHQQINNGNQLPSHAGKTKNSSNELLSEANHATLDARGTIETSGTNQEMAAVETIDRR